MPQQLHGSLHVMLAPEDPITPSGLHRYCIYVLFRHLGRQKLIYRNYKTFLKMVCSTKFSK